MQELADYRAIFRARERRRGAAADRRAAGRSATTNADRAEEHARKYIGEYYQSVVRHYELIGDHLTKMRGYEAYKADAGDDARARRRRRERRVLPRACRSGARPSSATRRSSTSSERTGGEAFTGVFSYGGMPYEIAEASLRLFAAEVMPELKAEVPLEDQLIASARPQTAGAELVASA